MTKTDRRVQRTRDLLQTALTDLISERGYAALTIRDIVERANVGRTTFYLHYTSKDDVFMSCHEAIVSAFHFGPGFPLSREELLAQEAPPGMIAAYRHLDDVRGLLYPMFVGRDSLLILRRIRARSAQEIEASLRAAFADAESTIPLDVLATYLAGRRSHWCIGGWSSAGPTPPKPSRRRSIARNARQSAMRLGYGTVSRRLKRRSFAPLSLVVLLQWSSSPAGAR